MHTNEPREVQGIELGYDPRDLEAKGLTKAVIYFFLFTLFFFGLGAIIWIRAGWSHTETFDARKPAVAGPLIQGNMTTKTDIMSVRQHEREMMTTYGTNVDGKQRIPVDRALDLLSDRGLPPLASEEAAKSPGTTIKQNATGVTPGSPGAAGLTESAITPTTPAAGTAGAPASAPTKP